MQKTETLYSTVIEVDERVTVEGFDEDIDGLFADSKVESGVLEEGTNGRLMRILQPLDEAKLATQLQLLRQDGYDTVAICFTHSYAYPQHEVRAGELAVKAGFTHVSLSSEVAANMIKMVPRGSSASADAYLTPEIKHYLSGFRKGFEGGHLDDVKCEFMQSDGGLVRHDRFNGLKGILSGPAGMQSCLLQLISMLTDFRWCCRIRQDILRRVFSRTTNCTRYGRHVNGLFSLWRHVRACLRDHYSRRHHPESAIGHQHCRGWRWLHPVLGEWALQGRTRECFVTSWTCCEYLDQCDCSQTYTL